MKKYVAAVLVFLGMVGFSIGSQAFAYGWTPAAIGVSTWTAGATSADGMKIVVAGLINTSSESPSTNIYTSTDGGAHWTDSTGIGSLITGIASSADGTHLVLSTFGQSLFISNDSGKSLLGQDGAGEHHWLSVAMSADGTHIYATESDDGNVNLHSTMNGGANWTATTISGQGASMVVSSADGMHLAVIEDGAHGGAGGYIYTSPDGGVTWTQQTGGGSHTWESIASDSTGMKLVASTGSLFSGAGYIYSSKDGGVTWTQLTSAGSRYWQNVASSADGTHLIANDGGVTAGSSSGNLYVSTDSGATWTRQDQAGIHTWFSLVSSNDGTKLLALAGDPGNVYMVTPGTMAADSASAASASTGTMTTPISTPAASTVMPTASSNGPSVSAVASASVAYGQSSPQVTVLQQYLIANGYLTGTATGFYGAMTKAAVQKLQATLGITSDGTSFGPKTRAALSASGGAGNPAAMSGTVTGGASAGTSPSGMPSGCYSNAGYSSTTGQPCFAAPASTSTPAYTAPMPTYMPGCNSMSGYSSTTGQACSGTVSSSTTYGTPTATTTAPSQNIVADAAYINALKANVLPFVASGAQELALGGLMVKSGNTSGGISDLQQAQAAVTQGQNGLNALQATLPPDMVSINTLMNQFTTTMSQGLSTVTTALSTMNVSQAETALNSLNQAALYGSQAEAEMSQWVESNPQSGVTLGN